MSARAVRPPVRYRRAERVGPGPDYETPGSVAFDLSARETITIDPWTVARIPVNLIVSVPDGYCLLVALRSSTPGRYGLLMPHGVGIIDRDYCGEEDEILIQVLNFRADPVTVERGARIAQAMFLRSEEFPLEESPEPFGATRGGFGSTGG